MNFFLDKAIKHSNEIENISIEKCGPSDDPDMQYAYSSSFRDSVASFLFYIKKIHDPIIQDLIKDVDVRINSGFISDSHVVRSNLRVVAEYLRELQTQEGYKEVVLVNQPYISQSIIVEISSLKSNQFNLTKLLRYIEELNTAYQCENYISTALLIRAIINYVPPIFKAENFKQVVSNLPKSLKNILSVLEETSRPIADLHTHMMIRKNDTIPTKNQIEPFKATLEILLKEIIIRLEDAEE